MEYAIDETNRRRKKQQAFNDARGITPESIKKGISDILQSVHEMDYLTIDTGISGDSHLVGDNYGTHINDLKKRMTQAASDLEFEKAALLRDEIHRLEGVELGLAKPGVSKPAARSYGVRPKKYKKKR